MRTKGQAGPTARWEGLPESHDGETPFTAEIHFDPEPDALSYTQVLTAPQVDGGAVTGVRRQTPGQNGSWVITITPSQGGDITVRLPSLPCSEQGAICMGGDPLEETAYVAVPGQPFTATFEQVPEEHDGLNPFDVHLHFSHEPAQRFSYRTVQEGLLDLTGGTLQRVWRLRAGKDRSWGITIMPSGLDKVQVALREATDCAGEHAVCDAAGRMLPGELGTTTLGPPTLSVSDTEVEEAQGRELVFTVTLSRALDEQVTVNYVTQSGTAVAGEDYTQVSGTLTFSPGTTTQTALVPVTGDQDDGEEAETMTMTLSGPSPEGVRLADLTATGTIR